MNTTLDNYIAPEWIIKLLNNTNKENPHLPHLLLYGPPGTGKTTFAKLLTKDKECLFMNASDERGIATIRSKVKQYAQYNKQKYIVLDECENLTKDSQTCLRRILEDFNSTTFIFITNYQNKIIEPIKSRTLKIKFRSNIESILKSVKNPKNVSDDELQLLLKYTEGDIRQTKHLMNALSVIKKNKEIKTNSHEIIQYLCSVVSIDEDKSYLDNLEHNFNNSVPVVNYIKYLVEKNEDPSKAIIYGELERMANNGVSEEIIYDKLKKMNL